MSILTDAESWGNSHRLAFMDYIRVVLGGFITFKGVEFMAEIDQLMALTNGLDVVFASAFIAHYVVYAHLIAGPLLALGLFTRLMAIVQIPILTGAVFMVNQPDGYLSVGNHMELEISIVVLVLLIVFMIFGAGKFSIDERRRQK